MTKLDLTKDAALPKLRTYLAALFNEPEKKFDFLPCYQGYLIAVHRKQPLCLWIHKQTVEGVLRVGFDLLWDTAEDVLFSLVWGAWALRQFVVDKFLPDPPKNTVIFLPGMHRINYGIINADAGATGAVVKGLNAATSVISKTGKSIAELIRKNTQNEVDTKKEELPKDELLINRSYTYIQFPDKLHYVLSKEKRFKDLSNLTGGFEFRTVYVEASAHFLKKISGFTLSYKGEKAFI